MQKDKILLILLAGILLIIIVLPTNKSINRKDTGSGLYSNSQNNYSLEYTKVLEDNLEAILSKTQGVGKVNVMITLKDMGSESKNDKKKIAPIIQGAVVVCEGADNPKVTLMIIDALKASLGIDVNKIMVLKMEE